MAAGVRPSALSAGAEHRGGHARLACRRGAAELERYLHDAYMANMPFVRMIHGKEPRAAPGRARRAGHQPPGLSFHTAPPQEGGDSAYRGGIE